MVKRSPDNGFTLVEVLVAMTILSVAIAGAVAALIQGNRMVEEARNLTRVSQIVQSEIEALRTMNWADLEAMPGYFVKLPLQGSFASKFQDRYTLYRLVVNHGATQKGVYLYVYWRSPEGFLRRQWHYARFTQGGLNDYFYRAF